MFAFEYTSALAVVPLDSLSFDEIEGENATIEINQKRNFT